MGLACSECSTPITRQSKTGRCKPCAMAHVNEKYTAERRRAAVQKRLADPRELARHRRQIAKAHAEARKDPAFAAKLSAIGRENIKAAFTPEARAKWKASRKRAAEKRTATMIAWCPPRLLDEYRKLRRRGDMRAADARAIIEQKITPFERQLLKVKAGAGIVQKFTPPPRSYDFTLAGGSPL